MPELKALVDDDFAKKVRLQLVERGVSLKDAIVEGLMTWLLGEKPPEAVQSPPQSNLLPIDQQFLDFAAEVLARPDTDKSKNHLTFVLAALKRDEVMARKKRA